MTNENGWLHKWAFNTDAEYDNYECQVKLKKCKDKNWKMSKSSTENTLHMALHLRTAPDDRASLSNQNKHGGQEEEKCKRTLGMGVPDQHTYTRGTGVIQRAKVW